MNNYINNYLAYLKDLKQYSLLTIKTYRNGLDELSLFYKQSGLSQIQEFDYRLVRGYLTMLHNQKLNATSIRNRISICRSFFRYLCDQDVMDQNPFELVTLPKKMQRQPDFLYYDEFEMLIEALDENNVLDKRNRMIFELLYATGMRVSEAVTLQLEDIDFDQALIRVLGKGSKTRYVPFNPICEQYLKEYIEETRHELMLKATDHHHYLIVNQNGNPITTKGVADIINRVAKKSKIKKHVHPHMFRHTFATHLLDQGANIRIVQEMMGHASLSSTQIYTHLTLEKLSEVYNNAHPMAIKQNKPEENS